VYCHILCVLYKPSRGFSRFGFKGSSTQQVILVLSVYTCNYWKIDPLGSGKLNVCFCWYYSHEHRLFHKRVSRNFKFTRFQYNCDLLVFLKDCCV